MSRKIVLIGGGTGLIGERLAELLADAGHAPRILTRSPGERTSPHPLYGWDAEANFVDPDALDGATHVVNLAGAGIADARWTKARKATIVASRVDTTRLLAAAIERHRPKTLRAFVSASAIGYYGDAGERWVGEGAEPGDGFLSESTVAWEAAVEEAGRRTGLRTVLVRTGIALSPDGGALEKMLLPARFGLSGYFGDGRQWYSWIHLDDLCRVYLAALDDERYEGPINAVAPVPVRNRTLAKALAEAVGNPALAVPVPAFALRLALGEMSHTVLDSTRVSSSRLVDDLGFDFAYPTVGGALGELLR